jgi:hypothetical protein
MSRNPDDNDDWCGVCKEGGDLLMCDGCHLSFHFGCVGYSGDEIIDQASDWFCWHCSAKRGQKFFVDTTDIKPKGLAATVYVAVDDRLEYYHKYDVVTKTSENFVASLKTGTKEAGRGTTVTVSLRDPRVWRGYLKLKARKGWVPMMKPVDKKGARGHPLMYEPAFRSVIQRPTRDETAHEATDVRLAGHSSRKRLKAAPKVSPIGTSSNSSSQEEADAANTLAQMNTMDERNAGVSDARPSPSKKMIIPLPLERVSWIINKLLTDLQVGSAVEVWVDATELGPGGWMPGVIEERVELNPPEKSGPLLNNPYFAFYRVRLMPLPGEGNSSLFSKDLDSADPVVKSLCSLRTSLTMPCSSEGGHGFVILARRPLKKKDRKKGGTLLRERDNVEVLLCGRYCPGNISTKCNDTKSCKVVFDAPCLVPTINLEIENQPWNRIRAVPPFDRELTIDLPLNLT